jgi:type IV pilus assembly protein PilQ
MSGMNFIASEAVADRKVTLYFEKVPLSQVMDKIFSANNLSYELDNNDKIFVVKDWGKMAAETVTKVFFLKNATVSTASLKEELSKSLAVNKDNTIASSRSKYKEEGEGGIASAIKKLLSSAGSMIEDYRTNSIIVTDTPMKMKVIAQVIAALDVTVPQVMLEVEMLDVSKDAVDKMGFKFGDTPFTAIVTGATAALGFPYGGWDNTFNAAKGLLSINPSGSTYDMQLDFIRTDTDTRYLARPKILTLNNETAEISITKDEIVQRLETPGTQTSAPTVEYKRSTELKLTPEGTGIFLKVTPQINMDTKEITMVINPKSSVASLSEFSIGTNIQKDVEVRSTKSIVKIKDGETVILGGLIHQDRKIIVKKLPILGDIPVLGALFRHAEQTVGIERELLVFITPRIIKNNNDINLAEIKNLRLPIREQSAAVAGVTRDLVINSNMNKFEKGINAKR